MAKIRMVLDNFSDAGTMLSSVADEIVIENTVAKTVKPVSNKNTYGSDINPSESLWDVTAARWSYTATTLDYIGTSGGIDYTFANDSIAPLIQDISYEVRYTITGVTGTISTFLQLGNTKGIIRTANGEYREDIRADLVDIDSAKLFKIGAYGTGNFNIEIGNIRKKGAGLHIEKLAAGEDAGTFTNLLTYSEEFDHANWNATATITPDSIIDPIGTSTAELINDTTGGTDKVNQSVGITADLNSHTYSAYFKEGTAAISLLKLVLSGGSTIDVWANIFWSSGNITSVSPSAVEASVDFEYITNGWYRVWITVANDGTNTSISCEVWPSSPGIGTVYAWGAQLVAGIERRPYIKTTAAAVLQTFPGVKEKTSIFMPADALSDLNSQYFTLETSAGNYYVWYDVDNLGTDPTPGGTAIAEINISEDETANEVASITCDTVAIAIQSLVKKDSGFTTDLIVTNLQKISRAQVGVTIDDRDIEIRGQFAGAKTVSALILGRHNLVRGSKFKLRLYSDTNYVTQLYNSNDVIIDADNAAADVPTWGSFTWGGGDAWVSDTTSTGIFSPPINFEHWIETAITNVRAYKLTLTKSPNNLLLHSEEFDNGVFSLPNNVTPDVINAPDGTMTGDLIEDTSTTGSYYISQSTYISGARRTRSFGVYLKQGTATHTKVEIEYKVGSTLISSNVIFNWSTKVISAVGGGPSNWGSTTESDGWYRVFVTNINNIDNKICSCNIYPADNNDVTDIGTVYAWGAQLVVSSSPGVYTKTIDKVLLTNFEIGRLFIGNFIEPAYNLSYGHSLQWKENTKQYRSEAGTLRSDTGVPYRSFDFDLGVVTEADRVLLQHQFRDIGMRKDFYYSAFSSETVVDKRKDYSAIAKITKVPKFTEFQCAYFKSKYTMEEV